MHESTYSYKYFPKLYYYPFVANVDRYVGSCNTLSDISNRVYVPNKTEDLNLHVFNMITGMNESKTLTKHISCKCECKFDGRKPNPNQKWNNDNVDVCVKIWKSFMCAKKIKVGILLHVVEKMVNI